MCRFVESIKIENGQPVRLEYHLSRMEKTRRDCLHLNTPLPLNLQVPSHCSTGLYKCRILYNEIIHRIEFIPYQRRDIKNIQCVYTDSIDYRYKYHDRSILNHMFELRKGCDDILIVKDGLLTDASSSNLVFWDGNRYYTPDTPLLNGTNRQYLIESEHIYPATLTPADIESFLSMHLINAMIDLNEVIIDTSNIHLA